MAINVNFIKNNIMKIYQTTIECLNSCYIETFLIVATNEEEAHKLLCEYEKRNVEYNGKLKELNIDMTKPNVIPMVGFGRSDSNSDGD